LFPVSLEHICVGGPRRSRRRRRKRGSWGRWDGGSPAPFCVMSPIAESKACASTSFVIPLESDKGESQRVRSAWVFTSDSSLDLVSYSLALCCTWRSYSSGRIHTRTQEPRSHHALDDTYQGIRGWDQGGSVALEEVVVVLVVKGVEKGSNPRTIWHFFRRCSL